ncbi:Exodeoxyribonuclease I [Cronobacter sakazakii]|nr:Exodeoxyribonuclease I [Cronobacter sakazakii]
MSDSAAQPTFLFHDYETFGKSPSLDRPAQFAALRTDENFTVIGEPDVFYCKPADDYLPQPEAVLITGITPQVARARGETKRNSQDASTRCSPCQKPAWSAITTCASMTK